MRRESGREPMDVGGKKPKWGGLDINAGEKSWRTPWVWCFSGRRGEGVIT